jgi:hypothetical protein
MNMLIEIFVRSFSTYMDVETCRDIVQHPMCAPEATEGLAHEALIDFRGRLFSQEDSLVLERVLDIADKTNKSVKIHDLSRVTDNFSALRHGIFKTPMVIINGKRYRGLKDILRAISANSET